MSTPISKWRWLGYPQHFIAAKSCLFKMATVVGGYLVSTVGDYRVGGSENMTTVGAGPDAFFETMVFPVDGVASCGCCPSVSDWTEIELARYATAAQAENGHMEMCRKYAKK